MRLPPPLARESIKLTLGQPLLHVRWVRFTVPYYVEIHKIVLSSANQRVLPPV